MDEIKWLEVAINTTPERLDEITAKLTAAGMTGLVIEDETEFQQFLEQNRQYWDYVDQELMERMRGVTRVKFYVTDDADGRTQLERYTRGLECEYTTRTLVDNDWAYSWQKYYKPLSIGERLYVVPQWEREEPVPQGRVPFYLNPGLTFGTGSHASTQLCLEGVEAHTRQGDRVLDLGCGSGILSIAALVLGAERASAVDIDPKAVAIARANAEISSLIAAESTFSAVKAANLDPEFVKAMLLSVARNWNGASSSKVELQALLPEAERAKFDAAFAAAAKELLEAGIEVGYSKEVRTGFKVGAKGGSYYISFSDDDFEALLKEYLRGKISELLFKA